MKLDPETEGLLALNCLGLAAEDEMNRIAELLGAREFDRALAREFDDLLAESMALNSPSVPPRVLLKERVMVATDPDSARVITDSAGKILDISAGFTDLCGYRIEEIRGRKPGTFLQGPGTDSKSVEQFRSAIRSQTSCTVELLNYHKSGLPYWVRIAMRPIFGSAGVLEGYTALEQRLR